MAEKEYIEREALMNVHPFTKCGGKLNAYNDGYLDCVVDARKAIRNATTADVVEVRYGYWEAYWDDDYMEYYHRCSECKSDAPAKQGTMCDQMLTTYCPNCGADMRGGKNG